MNVCPPRNGMLDPRMEEGKSQYYLRAEPTAEGRRVLRAHQAHLARVFDGLRINPRLTRADDLHWTTIFLGSPERWTSAFRAVGAEVTLTVNDLLELTVGNSDKKLPKMAPANFGSSEVRGSSTARPTAYDAFFNGGANAVFVLRLEGSAAVPARAMLSFLRGQLHAWERSGKLPSGLTAKFLRHPAFPLARERNGGKPHVTLARGRVSRERQRDVLRSIRATGLTSQEPMRFEKTVVRVVGAPNAVSPHA